MLELGSTILQIDYCIYRPFIFQKTLVDSRRGPVSVANSGREGMMFSSNLTVNTYLAWHDISLLSELGLLHPNFTIWGENMSSTVSWFLQLIYLAYSLKKTNLSVMLGKNDNNLLTIEYFINLIKTKKTMVKLLQYSVFWYRTIDWYVCSFLTQIS